MVDGELEGISNQMGEQVWLVDGCCFWPLRPGFWPFGPIVLAMP